MPRNSQKRIDNELGVAKKDNDMPCSPFPTKGYEEHTVGAQESECHSTIPIKTEWLQDVQVKKEPIEYVPLLHQQEEYSVQVEQQLLKCENEAEWSRGIPATAEQPREDPGTIASTVKLEGGTQHSEKRRADNDEQTSDAEGSKFFKRARHNELDYQVSQQVRHSDPSEGTASPSKPGRRRRSTRRTASRTSSTARVPQPLPESPEVRYRCPQCKVACPDESSLAIHTGCHGSDGDRPHRCHLCPSAFVDRHNLKSHLNRHWGVKPWKCSDCSYKCFTRQILEIHIRYRHSGERPLKCDLCDMAFASHSNLTVHRRIHTGEKPYACRLCPSTFRDGSAMRSHFLTRHSTARPYTCKQCGKSFALPAGLARHAHTHAGETPHLCHLCPAQFTRRSSLVVHVKNHTGVRPYPCEQCEKRFVTGTRLAEHVKGTHSLKPAYPCKLCPRKYKHRGTLIMHVKAEHPGDGKK